MLLSKDENHLVILCMPLIKSFVKSLQQILSQYFEYKYFLLKNKLKKNNIKAKKDETHKINDARDDQ